MGFYARTIFPWLCDLALDRPPVAELRRALLAQAAGDVLEIGIGTGLNLPHYPDGVRKIAAVDPNPGMHRRAQRRMREAGREVERHVLSSEKLPLADASFDCVVSTFTLCSIGRVADALAEIHRVLKPDGKFLFLEHGLSPEPAVQRWQRRLTPLQRLIGDNCHLDRNIRELVSRQPWQSLDVDEFYIEGEPRTHGYTYRGVARR